MLSDYLPVIEGFGILQGFTLLLFLSFFSGLVIYVWRLDKKYIQRMETMPLNENETKIKSSGEHND